MKRNLKIVLLIAALAVSALLGGFVASRMKAAPAASAGGEILPPPVLPGEKEGLVVGLVGECFVRTAGAWKPLDLGDRLTEADTIRTLAGGWCEVQFGKLAAVRIKENTEAELKVVKSKAEVPELRLRLLGGTVLYKVKKAVGLVKVETSSGVLGVRGTEFLVRESKAGSFVAVKDGLIAFEGGEDVPAGSEVLKPAGGTASKPVPLSQAAKDDVIELVRVRLLELPDAGVPRMAGIVVNTEPKDAFVLVDGRPVGRGGYSLIVPFGETVKLSVVKTGYKRRDVEIPVLSAEAGKTYVVRLELDPAARQPEEVEPGATDGLRSRLDTVEKELKAAEEKQRVLSRQKDALESEKDAFARKAAALEAEIRSLNAKLADQEAKVKNALELLQGKK